MLLRASLLLLTSITSYGLWFLYDCYQSTPSREAISARLRLKNWDIATEVFDRHGEWIGEFSVKKRYFLPISRLPEHVKQAFISAEDQNFYQHRGVDLSAMLRALLNNLQHGKLAEGASTLTQQLARGLYLSPEKTWERKIKEIFLALRLEELLSKEKILELYLNKIYLGNNSYGIEAASRRYFGKSSNNLALGEAALLAGLAKAPSYLAPHKHYQRAKKRQLYVLKKMWEQHFISKQEWQYWSRQALALTNTASQQSYIAAYFMELVKSEWKRKFAATSFAGQGLKIYTTLDRAYQQEVTKQLAEVALSLNRHPQENSKGKQAIELAFIALESESGAIRALQGGSSFAHTQFNRSVYTKRRIHELFLPLAYSFAAEEGISFAEAWASPASSAGVFQSLYASLIRGELSPLASFLWAVGVGNIRLHAYRLGLSFPTSDQALSQGGGMASPLGLATTFCSFFNQGFKVTPFTISRIDNLGGKTLYHHQGHSHPRLLREQAAFVMQYALHEVVRSGIGVKAAGLSPPLAGMPAVADNLQNLWFSGNRGALTFTLWLGSEFGKRKIVDNRSAGYDFVANLAKALLTPMPRDWQKEAMPEKIPQLGFKRIAIGEGVYSSMPVEVF